MCIILQEAPRFLSAFQKFSDLKKKKNTQKKQQQKTHWIQLSLMSAQKFVVL